MNIKIDPADSLFSIYIRERDNWRCTRCHTFYQPPTKALQNSHYFGRKNGAGRFNPDNCIALCHGCHRIWEQENREDYRDYMINWLGEQRFKYLRIQCEIRHYKRDKNLEYLQAVALMKELIQERGIRNINPWTRNKLPKKFFNETKNNKTNG